MREAARRHRLRESTPRRSRAAGRVAPGGTCRGRARDVSWTCRGRARDVSGTCVWGGSGVCEGRSPPSRRARARGTLGGQWPHTTDVNSEHRSQSTWFSTSRGAGTRGRLAEWGKGRPVCAAAGLHVSDPSSLTWPCVIAPEFRCDARKRFCGGGWRGM